MIVKELKNHCGGAVLTTDGNEKKKKTFLVEMDSAPIMGIKTPCECPACLSGPYPMCLIAGSQVQNLDHCPVLREIDLTKVIAIT